jgi:hypothetical protein
VSKRSLVGMMFAVSMLSVSAVSAQPPLGAVSSPNDYGDVKSWLCRPGGHDACDVDLTTTVIAADGKLSRETWIADTGATIDCFYVYPTVSTDQTRNSDKTADTAEQNVVRQQFARFGSKCRLYAPLYRQVTLAGLLAGAPLDRGVGYDDVRDAWNYYLKHDNKGRGFVLIGHSQGSTVLAELVRKEVDGKPVQSQLVSAILPGTPLAVPRGKDVGGAFVHVPLCHSASQTGCVITYASFRLTAVPDATSVFGKVGDPAMAAGCTNPAALSGGSGELHSYFDSTGSVMLGTASPTTPPKPWLVPGPAVTTPFVSLPGLLTARCASNAHATYLEVTVHGDPSDPRVDDIVGDFKAGWGLHLIDVNLALGNLVDIVGQQAKAYAAKRNSK